MVVNENKIFVISNNCEEDKADNYEVKAADFETAIQATGFGKFNLIYLLFAIPTVYASAFEPLTLSFILPAAECDLELSLQDKGLLNAVSYSGMIASGFFWGFLSDILGRKKLLYFPLLLNVFFVLLGGFSQIFPVLLFAKFATGFIVCGPYAIVTSALSEFHCAKYRTRILSILSALLSSSSIILPLIAWSILPLSITTYLSKTYVLHSWNFLIIITALPSLIAGIGFMCIPESPKFLMTAGRNEEALKVFQTIYALNTGKPPATYPIKALIDEVQQKNGYCKSKTQAIKEAFNQVRPLFKRPLFPQLVFICLIQFGLMGGTNTIRLWLPQIFQAINDYNAKNSNLESDLCTMLNDLRPNANETLQECQVNFDNDSVYINSMIVGATSFIGYLIVTFIINGVGKKSVIFVTGIIGGVSVFGMYFATTSLVVLILSSSAISLSTIASTTMIPIVVDFFPTTLRAITVSVMMVIGRLGAMTGNLIFPILISNGCLMPFLVTSGVILLAILFSTILPKTDLKALE